VFAVTKGSGTDQYLLLGINNGNGGSAILGIILIPMAILRPGNEART
jgi:hypothetical protein